MRVVLSILLMAGACLLRAADWNHVLPPDIYKELDLAQRSQVDKALKLYDKGRDGGDRKERMFHKSASNEWERFRVQYGDAVDPAVFAYSLFMQAMSERASGERHTAVKTFTEVLDFFPDEIWLAAPAIYFRGRTHFDIGDVSKGLTDFQEMLKDEDYAKHPLAGYAYNRLARNHWSNERSGKAVDMWETVSEKFAESNRDAVGHAENRLRDWIIVQGRMGEAHEWYVEREGRASELNKNINAARQVYERAMSDLGRRYREWYFEPALGEKRAEKRIAELRDGYRDWFFAKESWYMEADRLWEFMMIRFEDYKRNDPKELKGYISNLSAYLRKNPGEKQAERASELVGKLCRVGEYDLALTLLQFYPTPVSRLWERYNIENLRKQYEDADQVLEQLLAVKDPRVIEQARRERAALYHKQMGKYEEAIKLYYEINDPPDTLWEIVDCQRRNNQKTEAQNTLTEIASIFPDQASRAIFTKAEFFRHDGEKKMAVGLYRNLLTHPEWKKTGEASKAHDRLEDLGIATGGAVVHEVN